MLELALTGNPQQEVVNKAEYVVAANCYGQVLWIQNQMLDYGFNFINTKIHIDNESTICIVTNQVFHSKTKHIEIRHHFIRDSYEKRLIQVIKIHTDHNVVDLLTKAFDVSSDKFGVKTGSCKVNAAGQKQALQEDTQLPQNSVPIPNVADKAVFKEWDDKVVRATTTAASLDANSKLWKVGSCRWKQSRRLCTRFGDQKAKKEGQKIRKEAKGKNYRDDTLQDCDFVELDMKNVKGDAETQGRNTAKQITTAEDTVNTASIDVSAAGPSNVSTKLNFTSKGKMVEPEPTPKNPIKTQIQRDAKIAQKLFEEEQAQFERVQRIAREKATEQEAKDAALIEQMEDLQARIDADELLAERLQQEEREQFTIEEKSRMLVEMIAERKRFFAAQRTEQIRNKPPTRTQLRNKIITYLKNIGRFTHNQLKNRSLEEIQMLYEKEQKWIDDFVPMDSELEVQRLKRAGQEVLEEPVKRQKIREASGSGKEQSAEKEKELSEEELQKLLVVVLVEEVYVEALQVKYPIIDWEVYSEDTRRDDMVKLWDLVKERFSTTYPTDDKEKELWVELKRLFKPDNDDILWKLQRYMHDPLICSLYDSVMSYSDESGVTYTEVSSLFEVLSNIGSPRADDYEYLELPWMPEDPYVEAALQAPPSPDYMPDPEEPEQAPPSPDYSPDYVPDPEEDPVDYPADGGDDGDDEEGLDEEEEEHPAPADSVVVALPATDQAPSAEETEPFETDESAATPPSHPAYRVTTRISIPALVPTPVWSDAEVARLLAISTPPSSPLSP
ncbi:hypothetical protein Tco_0517592 [Tanacetum coccineum]